MKLATLCYIQHGNKTLFLHRIKKENDIHQDKWIGLGGKVEKGESPEEGVIREVKEESGLDIVNPDLRGIMTFPNFGGEDWYVFLFTTKYFTGDLIDSPEGELHWVENSEINKLNISDGDRLFLDWLKEKNMFSAKFIYDGEELIDYFVIDY